MDSQIVTTVHRWLSLLDIRLPKSYLNQRLKSHPDFPSALSITSLLEDLGIANEVVQVDETQLSQIPAPYLAFVDAKDFILVTDFQKIEDSVKEFSNRWNGIIITAKKPATFVDSEEISRFRIEEGFFRMRWLLSVSLLAFLSCLVFVQVDIRSSVLFLLATLGAIVSGSIVLRELGIETVVSQRLCGAGEDTGCESIRKATIATLLPGINLSDIGVSFFSGIMLLIWISSFGMIEFQHATRQSIAWLTFASIPFTLFSLYYQGRVIKKWCISCLLILSILWIMAIMQGFQVFNLALINGLRTAAILGVFILPGSIWVWVKNLLIHKQELGSSRLVLQQFYRNPELFETYVLNQEKVDIPSWSFDFQIGNADAPCELVVVSSLFCGPCVDTYKILQNLLKKHEGQLSIRIRFLVDNKGKLNGLKGSVARYMLAYAVSTDNFLQQPQKVEQMLQTWYSVTDMEKFSKLYPLTTDIDVEDLLRQQREWFRSVNIRFTPTIFINGYPLNSPYTQTDLLEFSGTLLDMFSSEGLEYASHADPIHINQV